MILKTKEASKYSGANIKTEERGKMKLTKLKKVSIQHAEQMYSIILEKINQDRKKLIRTEVKK